MPQQHKNGATATAQRQRRNCNGTLALAHPWFQQLVPTIATTTNPDQPPTSKTSTTRVKKPTLSTPQQEQEKPQQET